ncbi:MAG: hypothetical protein IT162_12885 [Bryobacterales bacterium]|nr:hypothetical protein [Bryobacterales bacterium]
MTRHAEASVFLFLAPDCPRSERAQPALRELHAVFQSRGVRFFAVAPGEWSSAALQPMTQLPVPLLLDRRLVLTRAMGARVTPEAVILNRAGSLRYRGAVEGVREALDAALAKRPAAAAAAWPRAFGCAINATVIATAGFTNYHAHAAPILARHCVECHRAGGTAPFALDAYAHAAPRAAAIAEAVTTRRMPPWKPDPGPPHILGERRLSPTEIQTLAAWARTGAPAGTPRAAKPDEIRMVSAPPPAPDHVAAMRAPFPIPAGGPDLYRCFVVPAGLDQDRWVRAFRFEPGDPRAVHHALIFVDHTRAARRRDAETPDEPGYECFGAPGFLPSSSLGGWAPGTGLVDYPPGAAVRLRRDADLVLQLHYSPGAAPREDRSSVGLYFTDTAPTRRMMDIALGSRAIDIPAGANAYKVTDSFELPVDVIATGIIPHAHFLARTMRGWAVLPDGRRLNLLTIRDWDFNWQMQYRYRDEMPLPAGTRLEMEFTYDNSAANPRNPSRPPRRVTWGPASTDEMAGLHVQITPAREEDAEELGRALWGKIMRELGGGMRQPRAPQR